MDVPTLEDGPANADVLVIFAHGSGQPMDHPSMERIALHLAGQGIAVLRFEFPYMAKRRALGGGAIEVDNDDALAASYLQVASRRRHRASRLFVGGWSLGARVASEVAGRCGAQGLVGVSFPFHAKGDPGCRRRVQRLIDADVPTLIVQGSRDAFGNRERVTGYRLPESIRLYWVQDANHGLQPRVGSGMTAQQCLDEAATQIGRAVLGSG